MADAKKRNPAKPEFPPKLSTINDQLSTISPPAFPPKFSFSIEFFIFSPSKKIKSNGLRYPLPFI